MTTRSLPATARLGLSILLAVSVCSEAAEIAPAAAPVLRAMGVEPFVE